MFNTSGKEHLLLYVKVEGALPPFIKVRGGGERIALFAPTLSLLYMH